MQVFNAIKPKVIVTNISLMFLNEKPGGHALTSKITQCYSNTPATSKKTLTCGAQILPAVSDA